jgi:hypothetical protein
MQRLLKLQFKFRTVPIALLGLCIAAFGLLIPDLGYYWDDWTQILISRLYNLSTYWEYFSYDRPSSAWTHILFAPILGGTPMYWQAFTMLLRWLTGLGMWWTFCGVWPAFKRQVTLAALLFLVYPSFTQQPHAVSYHQHFTQYLLFFLSMGAMVYAQRKQRRFWIFTALSLVSLGLHLSITEFFIGAEFLLRPLLLWFLVIEQDGKTKGNGFLQRVLAMIKLWWPYLLVTVGYTIWRLYLVQFPEGEPHGPELLLSLFSQPLMTLTRLMKFLSLDTLYILVTSWSNVLDLKLENANQPVVIASWVISLAVAVGLIFYLSRLTEEESQAHENGYLVRRARWLKQALLTGVVVALAGPSPLWVMGFQMVNPAIPDFHVDRFSLVSMFGVSLLIVALIEWGMKDWLRKVVFLSLLVGLAAGFQVRTENDYRWVWTQQLRFYWQLTWRAPHIEAPTALVAEEIFLPNQELVSTASALNLLYPQESYPENLSYWLYRLRPRYSNGLPEGNQISFNTSHRMLKFAASTPESLLIQFDPEVASCLWVLDPVYSAGNPDIPKITLQALSISNLDRIASDSLWEEGPPADLFGEELPHGWCYLFQKADLARQMGDWKRVIELGEEANNQGFSPAQYPSNSPYEWTPFIEGYLHQERWDEARDLTLASYNYMPKYGPMLCDLWQRTAADLSSSADAVETYSSMVVQLGCETE